jgi:hypothetical protein
MQLEMVTAMATVIEFHEAVMAKVIKFYKRRDWKPKSEWVHAGQQAKVIMFPTISKKSA